MKINYDPEADAVYVSFSDVRILESEEVRPGIVLDLDAEGRVVGIEILDASKHLAKDTKLERVAAA